jgi:hypothetical protein
MLGVGRFQLVTGGRQVIDPGLVAAPSTTAGRTTGFRRLGRNVFGLPFGNHRRFGGRLLGTGNGAPPAIDIGAGFLVPAELQQPAGLGFFQQVAEGTEAVAGFAEIGLAALDGFLEHRGPDLAGIAPLGQQASKVSTAISTARVRRASSSSLRRFSSSGLRRLGCWASRGSRRAATWRVSRTRSS